jgi:hypothetical protein
MSGHASAQLSTFLVSLLLKRPALMLATHHNKAQLLGYEIANVALILSSVSGQYGSDANAVLEMCAAVALLSGSLCIWFFDDSLRPSMLFYGGIGLVVGGLFLTFAGYPITGLSVVLASLETTRGGLFAIVEHCERAIEASIPVSGFTRKSLRLGSLTFGWYIRIVRCFSHRCKRVGVFIDTRPFLTSALIKAPLRIEFIAKKAIAGDFVGVLVGLSWMILGDGGLALNDSQLNRRFKTFGGACQPSAG